MTYGDIKIYYYPKHIQRPKNIRVLEPGGSKFW